MAKEMCGPSLMSLRGSRRWTEEEGRRVVEAWQASGESVLSFARRSGLLPQRVYWWVRRLRRSAGQDAPAPESAPLTFVPVALRALSASTPSGVTVVLGPDSRIEVGELDAQSASWVATVLRSLRSES